jgi:hypothetical protein
MLVRSRRIVVCNCYMHCGNPCVFQQEFVKFREQLIVLSGNYIHSVVTELGVRSHHCAHATPLGFRCAQAASAFAINHVWISLWLSPMAYRLHQAHGAGGVWCWDGRGDVVPSFFSLFFKKAWRDGVVDARGVMLWIKCVRFFLLGFVVVGGPCEYQNLVCKSVCYALKKASRWA